MSTRVIRVSELVYQRLKTRAAAEHRTMVAVLERWLTDPVAVATPPPGWFGESTAASGADRQRAHNREQTARLDRDLTYEEEK